MPEWLFILADLLCLLGGIVLTHTLFLYAQFYTGSQGYMWRAARKIWFFLIIFFNIEWIIGAFFFFLSIGLHKYTFVPRLLIATLIGIVAAAIPTTLEYFLLPKTGATVETLERPLTRLLLKLNLILRHKFAWGIECCREQDLFDCQVSDNSWGLGLSSTIVARRIRQLYEFSKFEIAKKRKDPSLLYYDVDRNSWEKFYLLVRHVGRKKLREYIMSSIEPASSSWNGSERRRMRGSKSDRDTSTDSDSSRCRLYDDQAIVRRVRKGDLL